MLLGNLNKPFNFLDLDSCSEQIYLGILVVLVILETKQIFTVKSLILAQDER